MKFALTKPATRERRDFVSFYNQYAALLWGLILRADLPDAAAETILINTFSRAWQLPQRHLINQSHRLTWLLGLAREEGLPVGLLLPRFQEIDTNTAHFGHT